MNLPTYLVTLPDGRATTVEAESEYLARAAAAIAFGADELPADTLVLPVGGREPAPSNPLTAQIYLDRAAGEAEAASDAYIGYIAPSDALAKAAALEQARREAEKLRDAEGGAA